MIRQDRFLLGILIGIGVVVVLAVGLAWSRQGVASYGPEDTPQGVFQNYILAVSKGEMERAFGYISPPLPQPGVISPAAFPDFNRFQQFFLTETRSQLANTGVQINDTRILGGTAVLDITILQTSGDPFRSVYRQNQQAQLIYTSGAWKITQAPYPFWSYDWSVPQGKEIPAVPAPTKPILPTPTR